MPENMNRHLTALEFDKILSRLAEFTACPDARELAMSLRPESNLDLAQAQMNRTRDAHMLLARFGGPSFGGLRNVNNAAARAGAGSTLSLRELSLSLGGAAQTREPRRCLIRCSRCSSRTNISRRK